MFDAIFIVVGDYPSFIIDTNDFQPGQHRLVLSLRIGNNEVRVSNINYTTYVGYVMIMTSL